MTNDYTDDGAASGADDGTDNTVITGEEVWSSGHDNVFPSLVRRTASPAADGSAASPTPR